MSTKLLTLTKERLCELLDYDPKTGVFVFKVSRHINNAGDIAGWVDGAGYLKVHIDGGNFSLHRLAFLYMTGEMPVEVDHINHDRKDNRWINLRPATRQINGKNQSLSNRNSSGVSGVNWCNYYKKWQVRIRGEGIRKFIGYFSEFDEAVKARSHAEIQYGYHKNHGKKI